MENGKNGQTPEKLAMKLMVKRVATVVLLVAIAVTITILIVKPKNKG